jgi:dipeptidyl aminopeptidase/acylaminoacyl peptidase
MRGGLRAGIPLFILAILFLCCAPAFPAERKPDGTILRRQWVCRREGIAMESIVYASDGLEVTGLLFSPPLKGKLPCVIFCHDGMKGISREHRLASLRLAKAGYAVFSPSYRGEDGSQGDIEIAKGEVRDVLHAITMISRLEHIDAERIALAGASHGATIDLLAAARTDRIKALALAYGIADIYKWWNYLRDTNRLGKDRITMQTYGKGPADRPASFSIRNGISGVPAISCPVLIMQGRKDEIVPEEQALCLAKALKDNGRPHSLKLYPHCGHGFLVYVPFLHDPTIDPLERQGTEEAWKDLLEFLETNLK